MKSSLVKVLGLLVAVAFVMTILAGVVFAEDESLVFGNITWSRKDIWTNYSILAFEYAARQKGVETIILDPEGDLEKAMAAMEDLITRGVDGISVFTITPELSATMIDMANEAGVPITIENSLPAEWAADYVSCVACQYDDIGYAAGKFVNEAYPGTRLFYVMGAPGMGITELYEDGLHRALEEYGTVELVSTQPTDWGAEQAMNVTQNAIQAGLEFDVIFANNEQMATGVINALEDAGLLGEIPVIATGGGPHGLELIEQGLLDATMSAPVSLQGLITFKNLYEYVKYGIEPPLFIPLPIIPVTQENLAEAISWEVTDENYERALEYIGGIK